MITTRCRTLVLVLVGCCTVALLLDVRPTPAQGTGPKAAVVDGQADFMGNDANRGAHVPATTLFFPLGIVVDSNGGIFVADRNNNRVLHFPRDKTTPDRVYGQSDSFTQTSRIATGPENPPRRVPIT